MIVSQFIQRARDELDDPNILKWSDREILRHADEQMRGLFRLKIKQSPEWSNFTFLLQKEDARKLFSATFEWRLPTWIEKVIRVYNRGSSDGTGETTFSVYNWTQTGTTFGSEIPKTDPGRRRGWTWEGRNVFRLWGWATDPPEIIVEVAASPAPLFKATIAQIPASPVNTAIFLPLAPVASDLGDFTFLEEGRYVNGECEVVATSVANDLKLGKVSRIIYSNASTSDGGTRRHQLSFDTALPTNVAVGDVFESLIPLEEMHTRLLLLKVVNACAVKKFNIDLQKSIAGEMQSEMAEYMEWARAPRDSNGPYFYKSSQPNRGPYNPNLRYGYAQGII